MQLPPSIFSSDMSKTLRLIIKVFSKGTPVADSLESKEAPHHERDYFFPGSLSDVCFL
jgi:hypothetical protein